MNRKRLILSLVILFILCGCTGIQTGLKPEQEFLMRAQSFYISQYNDYQQMVQMPNLTEMQKDTLRKKKAVLVQVEPLLKIYSSIVYSGATPDSSLELQITTLLNSIGGQL